MGGKLQFQAINSMTVRFRKKSLKSIQRENRKRAVKKRRSKIKEVRKL